MTIESRGPLSAPAIRTEGMGDKPLKLNRRNILQIASGGAVGAAALTALHASGGVALATAIASISNPVHAQEAASRGLPRVKITDIKVIRSQPVNASGNPGTQLCNVKILTDEPGLYGIGDGNHAERPYLVQETINKFLAPAIIGRYVDEIEDIWNMSWVAPYWRGSVDASNAMSAIDSALWDIMGKRAGMPVYDLFGGKVRPSLPMYTNVRGTSLQEQAEQAAAAVESGYRHLRVGGGTGANTPEIPDTPGAGLGQGNLPGGGGLGSPGFGEKGPIYQERGTQVSYVTNHVEAVANLRDKIGWHIDLLGEADAKLWPSMGATLHQALEPFRMFWVEEALGSEDVAWYRNIRQQTSTPIAVGEVMVSQHEWLPLVQDRLMDFMRMHISACGGMSHARKVAHVCEFFGVKTAWHGPGNVSPVGHAVNMHIDLAAMNFGIGEGGGFSDVIKEIFPGVPELVEGHRIPNDLPGLGVDLIEEEAAKYPPQGDGTDRGTREFDGTPARP